MAQLNSDILRTFLAVAEAGSVTQGAARIFRSQSAASLQIGKLEATLGHPVFERHGRGVVLTEAGERLLPVAREVTGKLDAALRDLTSDDLDGRLRLGIPDDQSKETLSRIVGEFAQSHPLVDLEVTCAMSAGFPDALASGSLDLAIYEVAHPPRGTDVLRRERTCWMVSRHHDLLARDPLPIALFDRDCWWRDAALDALRAAGRPFRVVYSSQSVAGVAAALEAGIAAGLLGETSMSENLRQVDLGSGEMPVSSLVLGLRPDAATPPIEAMRHAIRKAFGAE
ncbi:LysR family transcriptional regulator [Roseibium marinum]|uniref:DNA-binding transcriptional LysR family regulator n=1 Tax=Roseibium marinum TaxID=281252 RepID=A0A2S3UX91_9HYPH|nr:LysR family transcriptional regulator [Roseibium marinum]POF32294.1 DNA-binding transcriptional LysR family regulator [Roseibium marinum]